MRHLNVEDIDYLAIGAAVLGAGGGGDPYLGKLMAQQAIVEMGPVELIDADDVPDDDLVIPVAMMGAPAVMMEKLPNGSEPEAAFHAIEAFLGRKAYATISAEAGGLNSCIPVYAAARLGVPLVDGDGMGRAFPEIPMCSYNLAGTSASPMVCLDEKGNEVLIRTIDNPWVETISRSVTVAMGLCSMIGLYVMDGRTVKRSAIRGTLSLAVEIGRRIREAKEGGESPVDSVLALTRGATVFEGKLFDITRDLTTGFVRGRALFEGLAAFAGQVMTLDFQNEMLVAAVDGVPRAMVPDLITLLDRENGVPITTETLRYGQRAFVVAMPCADIWRTEEGLRLVGPRYFGYDYDYTPMEELVGEVDR